ncbi:MAG: CIA30 family protein [bacterium]|nr:CIA30 family protein [bacterium]
MKKIIFIILVCFASCTPINDAVIFNNEINQEPVKEVRTKSVIRSEWMIDDFNKKNRNSLKGNVNPWAFNPKDVNQICKTKYSKAVRQGNKGFSLQIIYDVDSPSQAFNGIYSELNNADFSPYNNLVFWIKGDQGKGFTSTFKVELKNSNNQTGTYYVQGVTEEWQKVVIPFSQFKGISDFTSMKEFTVVFVDSEVTQKEGVLYMDDLSVTQ